MDFNIFEVKSIAELVTEANAELKKESIMSEAEEIEDDAEGRYFEED